MLPGTPYTCLTAPQLFEGETFLHGRGEFFHTRVVRSERDLEFHKHVAIEGPAAQIIRTINVQASSTIQLDLRGPARFERSMFSPSVSIVESLDEPDTRYSTNFKKDRRKTYLIH